ncbi:hypothetical protein QJS10_CPB21g00947 [Acorus calamus]|uniref:Uncharacterized protein n=1 Tax=Acorus calamus TaxID=4465 RepID=A0AAV9C4H8_ACOCL|nr:hypothetical protein QJS10_CPB21g00947 [Acorus calamus]
MNRRLRSPRKSSSPSKFLKPGALARLRDSRCSPRSSPKDLLSLLQVPPSPDTGGDAPAVQIDGLPCFSGRICGGDPRFLQRRRLVASRSVFFVGPATVPMSPSGAADSIGTTDLLLAH